MEMSQSDDETSVREEGEEEEGGTDGKDSVRSIIRNHHIMMITTTTRKKSRSQLTDKYDQTLNNLPAGYGPCDVGDPRERRQVAVAS